MHHIYGTCKMGPESAALAVVDQYGRVHGLTGLHVVDAPILSDGPRQYECRHHDAR
jgi:choline dehydrogenase